MRFVLILSCLFAGAAHAAPRLIVPADLSVPAPSPVIVYDATPGVAVTITTERLNRDGTKAYVGRAEFIADRMGRVDTGTAAARSGTYTGVDPLGLFWSAAETPSIGKDLVRGEVRVTATAEATTTTALTRSAPDPATLLSSRDTPFFGAVWVRPRSAGRHPVVIVLGGSEGGSSTARECAPLFAARGYATLGLPYYDPGYDPTDRIEGLPHTFTDIPVDRLAQVRAWLATQPDADASSIALWGVSKGAEFALIAASRFDWIRAVVAVVPTDVVWEGWGASGPPTASFSFDAKPLAFQPYAGMDAQLAKAAKGEVMDLRRVHLAGRAAYPDRLAAARIPIERFHGALLLVAGGADQIWPSAEMAVNIVAARRSVGADRVDHRGES
ncbi:acyl-CoA thioesterase/BAAT N-terminal domain-containing protein (plasmid) [Polymorphobacter sp. PAMC 29334]|uniref:acyl-CoA thioesterase/BAAT N-terminal domain-containing protein n=1 Tax=Polymorphobacter sp. PAMC 29334 TaxID=2862331 RepID=UPI001C7527A3|nr:acyl-CoA thioester hydrolase/BAAT C-terminal domain-containing protein [Polymorphobacter sp. PAMC 29334]QYE33073.1 acyl-CoA thioesterase/BAAT N-terminal domain-containing protein [Polymorphobacter sp. PAMC 29334]